MAAARKKNGYPQKTLKRLETSKISTKPQPMELGTSLRAARYSEDRWDRALPGRGRGRSPLRKAAVPVPSEGARRRLHFRAGAEAPAGASGPGLPRGVPAAAATAGDPALRQPLARTGRDGKGGGGQRQSGCLKFLPAPPVCGTPRPPPLHRPPLPTWAAGAARLRSLPARAWAAAAREGLRGSGGGCGR